MPIDTNNSQRPPRFGIRQFGGSLLILLTILLGLNLFLPSFGARVPEVPYSDFIQQVEAGKVSRAIVGPTRIEYILNPLVSDGLTREPSDKPHL